MQSADKLSTVDTAGAKLGYSGSVPEGMSLQGWFTATMSDANGKVLWEEQFPNLVTTVGKNFVLDNALAGSAYTATMFIGLISSTSYTAVAAADTMASHAGWTESQLYSQGARPTAAWSAAAAGVKALSAALTFSMNATDTIKGCFMTTVSTKGGTTGTLISAGLFTGGDQPAVNGNSLAVSYQLAA
jgi:hypothetical protein